MNGARTSSASSGEGSPDAATAAATAAAAALAAERYGRRPARHPRRGLVITGAIGLSLGLAWAGWVGLAQAQHALSWQNIGYTVLGDGQTRVTFEVTMPPGSTAVCTVRALNTSFAEVGLLDVTVGPSRQDTVRTTVVVPTGELAVTGVVKDCAKRH